jgi:hypothetical protein
MQTWRELEKEFNELIPQMQYMRLDAQWGAAGEYWHLAGGFNRNAEKRFVALAHIAGEKLAKVLTPGIDVANEVLTEINPAYRWYKGIWKISGNFEYGFIAEQKTDKDESAGFIQTGTINNIAEASATFCVELTAKYPENETEKEEKLPAATKNSTWRTRLVDAINLKPGAFGFSVDLKKLFSRRKKKQ